MPSSSSAAPAAPVSVPPNLRKTANTRRQGTAYLSHESDPFHADFKPRRSDVNCSSARLCVTNHRQKRTMWYNPIMEVDDEGNYTVWPERTDRACWNCRECFDTVPIPIPIVVNRARKMIRPYKWFCQGSCLLRYLIDHPRYNTDATRVAFQIMMVEHFGYVGAPIEAAPKVDMLAGLGGPYSVDEYRAVSGGIAIEVYEPPFVSNTLVMDAGNIKDGNNSLGVVNRMPTVLDADGNPDGTGLGSGQQWRIHHLRPPKNPVKSRVNAAADLYRRKGRYHEMLEGQRDGTLDLSAETDDPKGKGKARAGSASAASLDLDGSSTSPMGKQRGGKGTKRKSSSAAHIGGQKKICSLADF
jgi:hypothetical protein